MGIKSRLTDTQRASYLIANMVPIAMQICYVASNRETLALGGATTPADLSHSGQTDLNAQQCVLPITVIAVTGKCVRWAPRLKKASHRNGQPAK